MYSRTYKLLVSLPPILWVSLFLLVPYLLMFLHSFWTVRDGVILHQWNFSNYALLFKNPLYIEVLFRTARIAASVTLLSLLLGYPLAYFLSFHAGPRKELLYQLVIVPLWVSYLVRGYAWKTILGSDGVLNGFLQYLHLTHGPVSALLYSPFAVVLMLTHIYTPFVFLPIYASLEHIPRPLIEASQDLGASPRKTFFRVILPLSLPGLLAGATFAFVLSLGDFLAPLLVGGPSGTMIANLVQSLFGAAYDWPLGAAISVFILIITLAMLSLAQRVEKRWSLRMSATSANSMKRSPLLGIYAVLVFAFIYLPIVVLVVYSFNRDGVGGFPPRHFTFDWYRQLFADSAIWDSVLNSLIVAAGAVALSLTLGFLAALALDRADFPGKTYFRRLVLLPLILPGIITGLSLLLFAVRIQLDLSLVTIFLGHGTALISVATTEIFAGLQKTDRRQEEASLDLGATPWRTFWLVTLPNLKLSLIAAALLIFTLSMDEIAVTFFLYGREYTLPLEIWGRLRRGITPEINAISTLILLVSIILITVWYRLRTRSDRQ